MQRWTRFKSRYLIDFTQELTAKVRAIGGPQVQTARNIFAEPMLNPRAKPGSRRTSTISSRPTTGPRPWPCR
jgi:biofilm PGA synthesis lipoprotein PgaB